MNISHSPSGKLINQISGYRAFIPNDLPPKIEWNTQLVKSLSMADRALGGLSIEGLRLPNPHLFIRPFITREALLSTRIEGTQATLGEALADAGGVHLHKNTKDIDEVRNYILALDYGLDRLKNFPLSLRVIREIHEKVLKGVCGKHATPGEFRKTQNWIGVPGCTLNEAKYVPPPPDDLIHCLGTLEQFLYDETLPPLIHIALCHYQFEAIHPFLDGNGRVGRLLITLLLVKRNLLPAPLLYLSAFFESTRENYYQHLFNVSAKGAWNDWLLYFLEGIILQSKDVLSRIDRINNLILEWQKKVENLSSLIFNNIIKFLITTPYLTVPKVAKKLNVAFTTAQRAIQKLESLGVLEVVSTGKRDRVYCAKKILSILEESV